MKRRQAGGREAFAGHVPFDIGGMGQLPLGAGDGCFDVPRRCRRCQDAPAGGIGCAKPRVIIELGDFPDAVLLGVLHLVHAFCPGAGGRAVATEIGKGTPTALGRLAARVQVHHGLDVHVVVEPVVAQPHFTHLYVADIAIEVSADAGLADVNVSRIVGHGVVGEVLGEVSPHALVEVVAISALQALDGAQVFGGLHFGGQPRDTAAEDRSIRRGAQRTGRHGDTGQRDHRDPSGHDT